MTGSTCGVKGLFFCSMTACFSGMGATGCAISCSEMTTPEKSRWRDTASLRDSRCSMEPATVAAEPGPGDFGEAGGLHEPVHGAQAGGDCLSVHVCCAEMQAGREFNAPRFA